MIRLPFHVDLSWLLLFPFLGIVMLWLASVRNQDQLKSGRGGSGVSNRTTLYGWFFIVLGLLYWLYYLAK